MITLGTLLLASSLNRVDSCTAAQNTSIEKLANELHELNRRFKTPEEKEIEERTKPGRYRF